jgi:putative addiction module killer protein
MPTYEIRHYVDRRGRDLVGSWLADLHDGQGKVQIAKRLNRLHMGNFGDHKFCREGIWELRIDSGPGYRVYYSIAGTQLILLLCGGDKRTQAKDIDRAGEYLLDWQVRESK